MAMAGNMEGTYGRLAERVRSLRTEAGWSQDRLAGEAGLSRETVCRVESGRYDSAVSTYASIMDALGAPWC